MIDAAMAQLVEHILGKDEVPGPNPGSSSRHPRGISSGLWFFIKLFSPPMFARAGVAGAATQEEGRAFAVPLPSLHESLTTV